MAKKARNQSHTVSKIQIFFLGGGGGSMSTDSNRMLCCKLRIIHLVQMTTLRLIRKQQRYLPVHCLHLFHSHHW